MYRVEVAEQAEVLTELASLVLDGDVRLDDDGQEHVQKHEDDEEDEQKEEQRTEDRVSVVHQRDVEVSEHDTKQREPTYRPRYITSTDRHTDHATADRGPGQRRSSERCRSLRARYETTRTYTQTTLHHQYRHTDHATSLTQTHRPRYITSTDRHTDHATVDRGPGQRRSLERCRSL